MPYTTTYPIDPYALNPQDEANDFLGPGADAVANAVDYNRHDQEIKAMHDDLLAALVAAGGPANIAAMVTKIMAGYTDGRIFIGPAQFRRSLGADTWVHDGGPNGPIIKHTPVAAAAQVTAQLDMLTRIKALRGILIQKIDFIYEVKVAGFAVDVLPSMNRFTVPLNGNLPGFAGNSGGAFDGNHNTAVERRAIGQHVATFTPSSQVFFEERAVQSISINADDTGGGGTAEIEIYGAYLYLTAVYIDGA